MSKNMKNAVFTATFTDITNEGFGVCHAPDGRAVFVPRSLKGEEAEIRVVKEYKSYLIGRVERILSPSADRVEVDCDAFKRCGGCTYRHTSYASELEIKREGVKALFRRNAGMEIELDTPLHGNPDAYRNKLLLPLTEQNGTLKCGFYARHSHVVVPCDSCLLHTADFGDICKALLALLQGNTVYNEETGKGLLRHIYLRRTRGGDFGVCLIINGKELPKAKLIAKALMAQFPAVKSFFVNINTARTNTVTGAVWSCIAGEETLTDEICGKSFILSPASFFQVNPEMTDILYAQAAEFAGIKETDTVFDMYCGAGTVGLCVCPDGASLCGVEIVPQAVENAERNAALNGRSKDNTRFFCGDAAEGFAACKEAFGKAADVVLVDPPRSGLDESLITQIAAQEPRKVVYISCNPATLARDVKRFAENGYILKDAVLVDMFPRTAHVETVAVLSRRGFHEMKLHSSPFEKIKSGEKTIELRLYDEKRRQIKEGDVITFTNVSNGERMRTAVKKLHRFDSFEALYKALPLLKCGYTTEDVENARPSDMDMYYPLEKQERYGVVGIELCLPE